MDFPPVGGKTWTSERDDRLFGIRFSTQRATNLSSSFALMSSSAAVGVALWEKQPEWQGHTSIWRAINHRLTARRKRSSQQAETPCRRRLSRRLRVVVGVECRVFPCRWAARWYRQRSLSGGCSSRHSERAKVTNTLTGCEKEEETRARL